jgi:hypothetical protein
MKQANLGRSTLDVAVKGCSFKMYTLHIVQTGLAAKDHPSNKPSLCLADRTGGLLLFTCLSAKWHPEHGPSVRV